MLCQSTAGKGYLWVICSNLDNAVSAMYSREKVSVPQNLVLATRVQFGQLFVARAGLRRLTRRGRAIGGTMMNWTGATSWIGVNGVMRDERREMRDLYLYKWLGGGLTYRICTSIFWGISWLEEESWCNVGRCP